MAFEIIPFQFSKSRTQTNVQAENRFFCEVSLGMRGRNEGVNDELVEEEGGETKWVNGDDDWGGKRASRACESLDKDNKVSERFLFSSFSVFFF